MNELIEELKALGLQEIYIVRLEMYAAIKGNISICCLINDIINNFHSDQETEDKAELILHNFLKEYFNH
jgi:hypothetical protein